MNTRANEQRGDVGEDSEVCNHLQQNEKTAIFTLFSEQLTNSVMKRSSSSLEHVRAAQKLLCMNGSVITVVGHLSLTPLW